MGIALPYANTPHNVPVSQTAHVISGQAGGAGAVGDYMHEILVRVATAATSQVTLIDGATQMIIVPANTPIGVYSLVFDTASQNSNWAVTTAAGVSCICYGTFS